MDDLFIGRTPCDTVEVSYQIQVAEIMNTNCAFSGCHDANSKAFNIDLSSYEGATAVNEEQLLGSIQHSSGYIPMPQGSTQLDECSINTLQAWYNQGLAN